MAADRLSALDSAFLRMESAETSLHVASVAIFRGPAPDSDEFADVVRARLAAVPRYRQVIREGPLHAGHAIWSDDDAFDLDYHLRRTALPAPGREAELETLMSRLMSQHLRHDRPFWEMWLVEGLAGRRWALITKVHHCMIDGIAGTGLMEIFLDRSPSAVPIPSQHSLPPTAPASTQPRSGPALRALPRTAVTLARQAFRDPRRSVAQLARPVRGLAGFAMLARPATKSSIAGGLAPTREWAGTEIPIADVRTIRCAFGGTLNDVVLTAVTRGLRDTLLAMDGAAEPTSIRALIPVSVRADGDPGRPDNQVSAVVAELPVACADPVRRLEAVRHELDRLKRSGEVEAGQVITRVADMVPGPVLAYGLEGLFRLPQRFVTTVVTNVPGPRRPLYFAGRQLLAVYPYVPIADRLRLGVAILSYCDTLYVGVTADKDHMSHLGTLLTGITDEIADLCALSEDVVAGRAAMADADGAADDPSALPVSDDDVSCWDSVAPQ